MHIRLAQEAEDLANGKGLADRKWFAAVAEELKRLHHLLREAEEEIGRLADLIGDEDLEELDEGKTERASNLKIFGGSSESAAGK